MLFIHNVNGKSKSLFLLALLLLSLLIIGCHENSGNNKSSRVSEEQEISQSVKIDEPNLETDSTTNINSEKFSTSHPYLFFTLILVAIVAVAAVIIIIWIVGLPKIGYTVGGGIAAKFLDRFFEKLFKK